MKAVADALYAELATPAATAGAMGVYPGVAPEGAAYPLVTYQLVDGFDRETFGGPSRPGPARATEVSEWIVKAWDTGGSHVRAQTIVDALDAALTTSAMSADGKTVISVRRIRMLPDLSEVEGGVVYRQSGARYAIEVR